MKKLDLKSIVTLVVVIIFAILAIRGDLDKSEVMLIITMVFQSFFSYQTHKPKNEKGDGTNG